MHIVLVGPGALGCLLASFITRGKKTTDTKLTILDYNSDRANQLTRKGITYHIDDRTESIPVTAASDPKQIGHADVILLCVKSYSLTDCLTFCSPIISTTSLVIFMQNGIGHLEPYPQLQNITTAYGTTTEGATLLETAHVRHAGSGATYLGFLQQPESHFTELLHKTIAIFTTGGVQTHHTDSILTRLWAKLFINVGINALTATLSCKNGEILTLSGVTERMQTAIEEAQLIASKKGITIVDNPYQTARIVCQKTAENVSSMLQDVMHKRRTEIKAINGAIVELGKTLDIDTPENSLLCQQIKQIENSYNQKTTEQPA
jgi:2-dehydropantoate 2-reductase